MVVQTAAELKKLVESGWAPYFHKTMRRWYVRNRENSKQTKIITPKLNSLAAELREGISLERKKVTPEIRDEVIRRRRQGEPIKAIAEGMCLGETTVNRILKTADDPVDTFQLAGVVIGVIAGGSVIVTVFDKFLAPWNPQRKWWWERVGELLKIGFSPW